MSRLIALHATASLRLSKVLHKLIDSTFACSLSDLKQNDFNSGERSDTSAGRSEPRYKIRVQRFNVN